VKLVIEVDGSQHSEPDAQEKDQIRDAHLRKIGLHVMRFENVHVEKTLDLVLVEVERYICDFQKNPPARFQPSPSQPY
jgi:very-short-patch-repair endonuclease